MRYHELFEGATDQMSVWELIEFFKLESPSEKMHDATLPWINRNAPAAITRLSTNKKARLYCMLKLAFDLSGGRSYSDPFATADEFKAMLKMPVTLYRGGGGVYNPDYEYKLPWTSFTTDEKRSVTFSKYDGTYAMRAYMLPLRDQYWVVKLTIPLDEILLYLPHGNDKEVIISTETARKAEVVIQTDKGQRAIGRAEQEAKGARF